MLVELFYETYNNLKKYVFNSNLGVDFQIIMQYNKLCDDEDERERARRCLQMAHSMCKPPVKQAPQVRRRGRH